MANAPFVIAYVFWHAPDASTDTGAYEERLLCFHEALASAGVAGYVGSYSCALSGLPWLSSPQGYEDWYLLEDSGALDRINEAAVRPPAQIPHDMLARAAAFGAGGLYRRIYPEEPHQFDDTGRRCTNASWFDKPTNLDYGQLAELTTHAASERSIWQRQMVLGPGREFCVLSACRIDLPDSLGGLYLTRRLLG
jgi:hypothetical protein